MEKRTKTLAELADLVQGEVDGDPGLEITNLNNIESAAPGEITFVTSARYAEQLASCRASAALVPRELENLPLPVIRVRDANLAAAIIHTMFYQRPMPPPGVHERAWVGRDCRIADSVSIGPMAVLGDRVVLAEGVVLEAGVVIGDDVVIGAHSILEANAVVRPGCVIGSRVVLASGVVIGSDGFGYVADSEGNLVKRPQVGNVVIADGVEVGANSCIDRATFGTTRIGAGSKIDNLVQIGHNVEIGPNCIIVALSGIAGSTTLGRNVVMGGQSGIADHVVVGDFVKIAGRSGVHGKVRSGSVVAGVPAINYHDWLQAATAFSRVPRLVKEVRSLAKRMDGLSEKNSQEE